MSETDSPLEGKMDGNPNGDWAWETSTATGYQYPEDAHAPTRNTPVPRPPKHRRPQHPGHRPGPFKIAIGAGIAATIGTLVLAMTTAPDGDPATAAADTTIPATVHITASPIAGNRTAEPDDLLAPYHLDGNWLVGYIPGVNLPPGRYTVRVTGEWGGYWARCSNATCEISGGLTGLLDNRFLSAGNQYAPKELELEIEPTDYMVRIAGIELRPA